MFGIELREEKDSPSACPKDPTELLGKTTGLLLQLYRRMFGLGRCVVLDSGFCVPDAIVELQGQGVYAALLIKKRRFSPKHIKGQEIIDRLKDNDSGTCEAQHGVLVDTPFTIFALKEQKYVLMILKF
jgi:hypothetical protein